MPIQARVRLAHATLQAIADASGVDLLHVKGPALDASLRPASGDGRPAARHSTDADVLVRPDQVDAFLAGLAAHGWRPVSRFETGSPFGHAATWWRDDLGHADVHRSFPGVGAADAFDQLWAGRQSVRLAHRPVWVPDVTAQRLLLLVHAARSGGSGSADVRVAWGGATQRQRDDVVALAGRLDAEVALAAALGRLDEHADAAEHDLWQLFSAGGSSGRLAEWRARVKAAPTRRQAVAVALRALRVNTDHLARELQRPPTRRDIAWAAVRRWGRALRELAALLSRNSNSR